MTLMLASVTGPDEAEIAIAGGADIIDLKDPLRGALGAVDGETVRRTVAAVAGRRPVSAVIGNPPSVAATVADLADAGVANIKLAIDRDDAPACIHALAALTGRVKLVGMLFADRDPDLALLPLLAECGFAGAMLDTAEKDGRRLLDHWDLPRLRDFVTACTQQGLLAGLAGSLEAPDIPRLLLLNPAVLGFRGALCGDAGRAGPIDRDSVLAIRGLIPPEHAAGLAGAVDYAFLARGYTPDRQGDVTDRVFVHDFVLPVRIGAYAHERAAPQRVRFDVDVLVMRASRPTQDMRDVFSYDLIRDGIHLLVAAGHVPLVETLAERIADMLLAHPGVVKTFITLEKLEAGSGRVGVAIERTRVAARGADQDLAP
jgi:dihydroneopterin aldolase